MPADSSRFPIFDSTVNAIVILLGLGALWLYGRDLLKNERTVEQAAV